MTRKIHPKPNSIRDRQRDHEMERGREVAARAQRQATLERWEQARKISLRFNIDGNRRQAWLWQRNALLAETEDSNDFPTEHFVAQVGLAIGALVGFEGVKETLPPTHHVDENAREFAKQHVIDWSKVK